MSLFFFFFFIVLIKVSCVTENTLDGHESCEYWASIGECVKNPDYMLSNCVTACEKINRSNDLVIPNSFYDIKEKDINGNEVDFSSFQGKVVYVVNVASYCGYTEENYREFSNLIKKFRPSDFVIVLAPCNSFGSQEPGDENSIQNFAESKGFSGIILAKDEVNGPSSRPSFKYLMKVTGKSRINWNFDGKFLIDRHGNAHLPIKNLEKEIQTLIEEDEL